MNAKYVLLWILYFVQGIPYGLQSGLLPVYFRVAGLSLTKISLAKLLYVPWVLKVLWAPLVDQYFSKRSWLLLTMAGFVLVCMACSLLAPETDFLPVGCMLLLMNILASIQDITVDGTAVQLLKHEEIGYGNAIQVVAYKVGSIVAGGGMLTFLNYLSWESLFRFLAVIYALAVVFTWTSELSGRPSYPSQDRGAKDRTLNPWSILQELLQVPDTSWMAGFVLIYKLGEQGATSMFPLFLLDQDFSPQNLGFWNGIVAMAFSIAGSSLGGHLMAKLRPPLPLLKTVLTLRFGGLIFQTLLMTVYQRSLSIFAAAAVLSIFIQNFLAGLLTTLTFSMMMSCSQKAKEQFQATHYSLLATLEVLGKLVPSALAGSLVDWLGFARAFGLFLALSCASIAYVLPSKR